MGPPNLHDCSAIFYGVNEEVKAFGIRLQTERLKHAKHIRQKDLHYVFHDCAKPIPKKVDVLVSSKEASVVDIQQTQVRLTSPVHFSSSEPVVCNGEPYEIVACQDEVVTLDRSPSCAPGDTIRQSQVTSNVSDILQAFQEAWSKRWQKSHHLEPSQWNDIAEFINRVAKPIQWDFPQWTLDQFTRVVSAKKRHAAAGPDGVTRRDLLDIPPAGQSACLRILTTAESTARWPKQLATGIVSLLEKHPQASTVADYRRIVVYPILYRTWSTFRARQLLRNLSRIAPSGLRGGMPRQEARSIWYEIGLELESSHSYHKPLVGLVADLEKAFNHIPRQPIWQILHSLQVPEWLIRSWCGFVSLQERRFRVRTTTGAPVTSSCGYPEGCALSVASMCLIDLALDWWMQELHPKVRVYTFVDDWQLLHDCISSHEEVASHLGAFVSKLDMIMDTKKSYVWATGASDRKMLQQGSFALVSHAKTLGVQANFTCKLGNKTLVSRVVEMKHTWKQLRACLSPYKLKLKALLQLGWPKALHGVSSSTLAQMHFGTLRTGAVRGLRSDRIGTSPMLHLSVWGYTFDPEGWSILQTIKDSRDLGSPGHFTSFLLRYLHGDRIPRNGPTAILIGRLERLGWNFSLDGQIIDELGYLDIHRCPIDELRQRITWAWPSVMAGEVAHRSCFSGLHQIDLAETRRLLFQFGEADRIYLLCGLDGTMYTNKGKQHWQGDQADACPFCGQTDGFEHRLWRCPFFEQCRSHISEDIRQAIAQLPSCSRNHGWALRSPSFVALAKALLDVSSQPFVFKPLVQPEIGPLHLFSDGTCSTPSEPALRLAAWSITQAGSPFNPMDYEVVAAGHVVGLVQTSFGAELVAVKEALQMAQRVTCEVCIWCDCQGVISGIRKLQATQWNLRPSQSHFDLWTAVADLLQLLGPRV